MSKVILEATPKLLPWSEEKWKKDLKKFLGHQQDKFSRKLIPFGLEYRPVNPNQYNTKPYFVAIDTETFASNGNMIMLCNSEDESIIEGNPKELPNLNAIFRYLRRLMYKHEKEDKDVIFVTWNLKFDASVLLKSLDDYSLEKLYKGEAGEKFKATVSMLDITYLHKKCLTMKDTNHNTIKIYDAMQFFTGAGIREDGSKGSTKLDDVARAYKIGQKDYTGKYQNKKFPDIIDPEEYDLIKKYCIQDCKLTKTLMDIWVDSFYNNFGFYPDAFYSAGYLTSQYIKTQIKDFPSFRFIPFRVQELAYKAYYGGRFEIFQRGLLDYVHHYDINSAYPYAMTLLPNFMYGKWTHVTSVSQLESNLDKVGVYEIEVSVKEDNLCPFMFRDDSGMIVFPNGHFKTHVTSFELEAAYKGNYNIKIHNVSGYYFTPRETKRSEFSSLIQRMYDKRMEQTNEGQKFVYKVLINSGYGKFAQAKPEPKNLFNPIMAALITGKCRAMLLDAVAKNKDDIVMLATDGIFSLSKLDLPTPKVKVLGAYEYTYHPKMQLIQAGVYSVSDEKNPDKLTTHSRGFALRTFYKNDKGDYEEDSNLFDLDSYQLTRTEDDRFVYKIINMRPIAISQAIIQHKYSKEDISRMEYLEKEVDLNGDTKRSWMGILKNPNDHNYSRPAVR